MIGKRKKLIYAGLLLFGNSLFAEKHININLTKQMIYLYENKQLIIEERISSGKKGFETPTGKFKVLEKDKKHISNEYPKPDGGGRMDYMLRLTDKGIAIHFGNVPNYPDSHGCIRLEYQTAEAMFGMTEVGTVVNIYGKTPKKKTNNFTIQGVDYHDL